ncbi:hypothetical protein L249_0971 [Ophiocordyceps polyrhachis-furcata BCC 54312]|uniref:DNA polymerase epsilon subunit B n=1 Tax=Ophiocordyceps polyrhachis-furcata BCC 54312 TaxID=1330021 RepID=A0A367LEI8_9HYPO|nr:hypothetical protein L249_0971 [Ophiocordyceps polyrhachis-furcata BCC 54312]
MDKTPAPIFRRTKAAPASSAIPSSSPAFGTPVHPLKPFNVTLSKAAILPIILPPATLRPLAFRTFTKKYALTLSSSALQELASFIGRNCGSGWREDGLADRVLEEAARSWKNRNGGVIVDGSSKELHDILKTLEGNMSGGKMVGPGRGLPRGDSMLDVKESDAVNTRLGLRPTTLPRLDSNASFGVSALGMQDEADEDNETNDVRAWLTVINAYDQPRLVFNVNKKHFERETTKPSLFPPASHKTTVFRNRYHVIHQRLLRNEAFQTSAVSSSRKASLQSSLSSRQSLKITPIADMLGRYGSNNMLLGQLVLLPTGDLAISDLTGTIALHLAQAVAIPEDSAWFCPGMVVLVDGLYEDDDGSVGGNLGGISGSGVGGILNGRFRGFFIGQPPCEKRRATLGISGPDGGSDHIIGGGFGWIDFLGVGSQRAVGAKMRRLEDRLLPPLSSSSSSSLHPLPSSSFPDDTQAPGRNRIVIIGELNLDQPRALQALRKILSLYAAEADGASPVSFVLTGNFTQEAVMAGSGGGSSIEYKEYFDTLASVLADFPTLLQTSTFVFVPGDNDGWVSALSAGASVPLPRRPVPEMFTSRVRRAFATANADVGRNGGVPGSVLWTSNPARLTLFGPNHELVLFRDDLSARLRRNCVALKHGTTTQNSEGPSSSTLPDAMDVDVADQDTESARNSHADDVHTARKLVKTLLDQGFLAPFRTAVRPVYWDYASALHLYPLPSAMVLVDATAPPFCLTYEGCHAINPGSLLVPGKRGVARWAEYEVGRVGTLRECTI